MINKLTYSISFPTTGKAFSQDINFKPGLTIIRGENETGKSLILEMIRYSLYGVEALRANRTDYDVLDTNMTFTVKGEDYIVIRSGNKATLNGKLAVGTAAVNRKILDILGFPLKVFDIACAAMQGDLDKLTKRMAPAERRKMVEEVIGLTAIEEQEKECRASGNALKRVVEATENKLVRPEPITIPDGYENSDILDEEYRTQLRVEAEREQLSRMIEPVAPVPPSKPEFKDDVYDHEQQRMEAENERQALERTLQGLPAATRTRQDIDDVRRYYAQKRLGPKPRYTSEELAKWQDAWFQINAAGESVECPACGVEFNPSSSTIHRLPEVPQIALREVEEQLRYTARWAGYNEPLVQETDLTEKEADNEDYLLSQTARRDQLLDTIGAVPNFPSREEEAQARRFYEREWDIFTAYRESYETRRREWTETQGRLASLPQSDGELETRLKNSRMYEELKRRYDADVLKYTESMTSLSEDRDRSEGYFKGAEALKDVRLEAKQHLVPSLSRVASSLLAEMTEGKRTKVEVDEDFEVVVDSQPVRTLSGSGISVVNLALRIALGQVLTQSVVPLFLADEIDHDMDQARAEATHKSLKKLTGILDKVIVVTHKDIQGDHTIILE